MTQGSKLGLPSTSHRLADCFLLQMGSHTINFDSRLQALAFQIISVAFSKDAGCRFAEASPRFGFKAPNTQVSKHIFCCFQRIGVVLLQRGSQTADFDSTLQKLAPKRICSSLKGFLLAAEELLRIPDLDSRLQAISFPVIYVVF